MTEPKTLNESVQPDLPEDVWELPDNTYACDVYLAKDGDGWVVHVPALPGVVSEGDTFEGARENIREALCASIQAYRAAGQPIPWIEPPQPRRHERRRYVTVHCGDVK